MGLTELWNEILKFFEKDTSRVARWYFGGLASMGAATVTHPLDLIKVLLQTPDVQKESLNSLEGGKNVDQKKPNLVKATVTIVRRQGVLALYNGLTASWMRQGTYSTTRFAIYQTVKQVIAGEGSVNIPFYQKVLLAGVSGAAGGFVGTPADMINVRMQNDIKLPMDQRRNYKHVFDGLWKVYQTEGVRCLFNGATGATCRAVLITIGQLSMYDQFKHLLLHHLGMIFEDNLYTHFSASLLAAIAATTMTQPLDVMKTRMMNAPPGHYKSVAHCAIEIFKSSGILGFFKGYIPAFVRQGPHTILMFIFFEQLRMRFGYYKIPVSVEEID